jgi:hypothetical protein
MVSVWKFFAHALPIVDLSCLLFDVHGPVSILVWTDSLLPFLELNLVNLSNKPPLGCYWEDPPHAHTAHLVVLLVMYIALPL